MIWLGAALALASALLVNLAYFVEHRASSATALLSVRRPLASLRQLLGEPLWLAGYVSGWLGWGAYIVALWFAPLSLVQGIAAGGLAVLALLVRGLGGVRLGVSQWVAVAASVLALGVLATGVGLHHFAGRRHEPASSVVVLLAVLAAAGACLGASFWRARPGPALAAVAGVAYAIGDVATKAAVDGDGWAFVVVMVAANLGAFVALQLSFQRGAALGTAGVASVLTNAAPIVAGIAVFGERLPAGALGAGFVLSLAAAVAGAGVLAATATSGAVRRSS